MASEIAPTQDNSLSAGPLSANTAEQAVLGSILIDPDCARSVMDRLRENDFFIQENREIFSTISTMFVYGRPIDPITVVEEMLKDGKRNPDSTRNYIAQIMDVTPTSANVDEYVDIVRDRSLLRAVVTTSEEIISMATVNGARARSVLESAEQKIYEIRRGESSQAMVSLRNILPGILEDLSQLAMNGGSIPGLSTGLSVLDYKIAGLNRSDLILIAARPGMGKTSMALNIALHVSKAPDRTVAIFSLEMSREQLALRLLSAQSLVPNTKLRTGSLDDSDWLKIADAAGILGQANIFISDSVTLTVSDMAAKCRRLNNLSLIIIDYLQLMGSAGGDRYSSENRQQVVADISRALKVMAKNLNVPVLCLSQLSRANEKRDNKRPILSDLRDSGAIEQDADQVLFLYRDDYYNPDTAKPNVAECIIAKNRHGETGTVDLRWEPECTSFRSLETRYDSAPPI